MTTPAPKSVFISYRRSDSLLASRWLAEMLERTFGSTGVFVDTDAIRIGDEWPASIENALRAASVLVVVIGPNWLRTCDDAGRRRLDIESDWVRREIHHAIGRGDEIIPLLVSGAKLPAVDELPAALRGLAYRQAFALRDDHWQEDVSFVVKHLRERGFTQIDDEITYPPPHVKLLALSESEIQEALTRCPEWHVVRRPSDGDDAGERVELARNFTFRSFQDAIHFMLVASREIEKLEHHPDWRNVWRTISVSLSTWDIGHKPSFLDLQLAMYLENLYSVYE